MSNRIDKLPDDFLFSQPSRDQYEKAKYKFISEYEIYEGGFLGGGYRKRPDIGEAEWNQMHPRGYNSWWPQNVPEFNGYGQRMLAKKINEIIEYINKDVKN